MEGDKMNLGEDGRFHPDPMFFDGWIIDDTVSSHMGELKEAPRDDLQTQFLKGAVSIAREVRGTGYDWPHAAKVYASSGRERGLDVGTMERLLNLAWRWSKAGVTHWADLVREWVCVGDHQQFYHVPSRRSVTEREFGALFDHLSPVGTCPIAPLLLDGEYLQRAARPRRATAFGLRGQPVLECASPAIDVALFGRIPGSAASDVFARNTARHRWTGYQRHRLRNQRPARSQNHQLRHPIRCESWI